MPPLENRQILLRRRPTGLVQPSDTELVTSPAPEPADGEALLRTVFTSVTRHDFPAQLRLPDPEPVADYIRSMSGTTSSANPEAVVSKITARMFPDGRVRPVTITTHAGCLVCS